MDHLDDETIIDGNEDKLNGNMKVSVKQRLKDFAKKIGKKFKSVGNFLADNVLMYMAKLTDGIQTNKFDIYKDIEYGSEKHVNIAERFIQYLDPIIMKSSTIDENAPVGPYVNPKVVTKIRTRMDKTYHTKDPFEPMDNVQAIYDRVDRLCTLVESDPDVQKYMDTAVVKRDSIMGYPAYTKDIHEKLSWIQYAAYFIRNGFKSDGKVSFRSVFTVYYRRQWKSVSDKKVNVGGTLKEINRVMKDGWLLARNRQVFGGDAVNVCMSLAAQSCQHVVYKVFDKFINISTNSDFYKLRKGYPLALDLPQMDSLFSKEIIYRIAKMMEVVTGLKGWADYLVSAVAIYKDEDGTIKLTKNLANPSGQATVTITNFLMGLAINEFLLDQLWPGFLLENSEEYIEELLNKGDDTLIGFRTADDRQEYEDMLVGLANSGFALGFVKETPPAMLGYLAYTPTSGQYYMDYNYTNIAASLCQKEKQNTDYFYISWLAKKQILDRNDVGKQIKQCFNMAFEDITGMTYDVYAESNMSDEERKILSNISEKDVDMVNLLVTLKPEMALYKFKLSEISDEVLDMYYLSFTGEEVEELLRGSEPMNIDQETSNSIMSMPDIEDLVEMYNNRVA